MILSLSLFLGGCSFDESLESSQQRDGDDMNVIQDIWPQALDQMLRWERALAIVSQPWNISIAPTVLPAVSTRKRVVQPSNNQPSSITSIPQTSIVVPQPTPVVVPTVAPNPIREEDDSHEEDD